MKWGLGFEFWARKRRKKGGGGGKGRRGCRRRWLQGGWGWLGLWLPRGSRSSSRNGGNGVVLVAGGMRGGQRRRVGLWWPGMMGFRWMRRRRLRRGWWQYHSWCRWWWVWLMGRLCLSCLEGKKVGENKERKWAKRELSLINIESKYYNKNQRKRNLCTHFKESVCCN